MILFAQNAVPLPASPNDYEEGIAYWTPYTDKYVASGVSALSFLESAAFNKYMNDLCVTLQKYLDFGISHDDFPVFVPENPQENDIGRVPGDIVSFQIYQEGGWKPLAYEATKESVGYIDFSKCFTGNILDYIVESDLNVAGKIRIGNCVLWNDFMRLPSSECIWDVLPEQQDNNDCGNSYFLGVGQISIDSTNSPFFCKKIFGANDVNLQIGDSLYNMKDLLDNSAYILKDGTVCG
jgi:hypothetical protein